ncbi:MAG TPA: thioesterase family protein [Polyangiales bacterium]
MLSPFELATTLTRTTEGGFGATIPDHWQQGRGAFGGLVLAVLARAIQSAETDPKRALRSLLGDLCGPVLPGPASVQVRLLRTGNNVSNYDAQLVQQGEVVARASAVLSTARKVDAAPRGPTPPEPLDWQGVGVAPLTPPVAPVFTQHFEFRPTGHWPFAGSSEAKASGYVRAKETPSQVDAAYIIALLDAWWPAQFAVEKLPRPVATVSFAAQLLTDVSALDPRLPLYHRAEVTALQDGFFVEMRQLWSGATLVALNQQTLALLK